MDSESPWGVDGSDGQPPSEGEVEIFVLCEVMTFNGRDAWYVGCAITTYLPYSACTCDDHNCKSRRPCSSRISVRWEF